MDKHIEILAERFSKDSLMALATVDENGKPWVRTIDAIFYRDSFYTITYALSNKMLHIQNKNLLILILRVVNIGLVGYLLTINGKLVDDLKI